MDSYFAPLEGANRWKVRKLHRKLVEETRLLHDQEEMKHRQIQLKTNKIIHELNNKIFVAVRCSVPSFQERHEELIFGFCAHVIKSPHVQYPNDTILRTFNTRCNHTSIEKSCQHINAMCKSLLKHCLDRDNFVSSKKEEMALQIEKSKIKNQTKLRWKLETSVDGGASKTRYWTLWFLSIHGMVREARRMLETNLIWQLNVDMRDHDFGFTSLHYACKYGQLDIIHLLLEYGADLASTLDDGRGCLHLAATYTTSEIITELLILGVGLHNKDQYGFEALDLARQNNNKPAIDTLIKWNEHALEIKPAHQLSSTNQEIAPLLSNSDDDGNNQPNHQSCKSAALLFMDARVKKLQEAIENADYIAEISALRILEKHACLCLHENIESDGLHSLNLRWELARKMYISVPPCISLTAAITAGEELVNIYAERDRVSCALDVLQAAISLVGSGERELLPTEMITLSRLHLLKAELALAQSTNTPSNNVYDVLHPCLLDTHEALRLNRRIYPDAAYGENIEAIPILALEISIYERLQDYDAAVKSAAYLAAISRMHYGSSHIDSVRDALNHLRLYLILTQSMVTSEEARREYYGEIERIAWELLQDLHELNHDNETALELLRKCVEYLSVASIHVST